MIIPSKTHLLESPSLNRPLTCLKGIGPKRARLLARKGLKSVLDLLFFLPIRYEDRTLLLPISKARPGHSLWIKGKVKSSREMRPLRKGKGLFRVVLEDEGDVCELLWFHYRKPHLETLCRKGETLMAYGQANQGRAGMQMIHPHVVRGGHEDEKRVLGYFPVYGSVEGIAGQLIRSAIVGVLEDYGDLIEDVLPGELVERMGLPLLKDALKGIHLPGEDLSIDALNRGRTDFHRRLLFDRFFHLMLQMALRKKERSRNKAPVLRISPRLINKFQECLPFTLTGDQMRVIKEIKADLSLYLPMNRLVLGDVGCGKTVVAAAAIYGTVSNHFQAAVMAPTQILAQQHYEYFSSMPSGLGLKPVLLTGTWRGIERQRIYEGIAQGEYNLIVGTQALLQEGLSFSRLGLVVIDEQQRFGVRQRACLRRKGEAPHVLVMTATPIPRSLAMIIYGDMDISIIRQYPEGHVPVKTYMVKEEKRTEVYEGMKKRMLDGEQCLVICPVIEGPEEEDLHNAEAVFERMKKIFSDGFRVGLIHGRMPPDEKESAMAKFRRGDMDLLVGTTVVEVGVHAPGATVLAVEHPERFGLAQLHQLRGRVGRGGGRGLCLFMVPEHIGDGALQRIKVLVETSDGFEIAKKDLEMRGQGELMGLRQAGSGEMDVMEFMEEPELLMGAKRAAEDILESDPELKDPDHILLRKIAKGATNGHQ